MKQCTVAMPFSFDFPPTPFQAAHPPAGSIQLILRPSKMADADAFDETWAPQLKGRRDASFPWRAEIARAASTPRCLCLTVALANSVEALISLSIAQSLLEPERELVYIEYLGVAPWNQRRIVGEPTIEGLGAHLVFVTILLSREELGFRGRFALDATEDAFTYYRDKLGLSPGPKRIFEGEELVYFEADPAQAARLANKLGPSENER